MSEMVTQRRKKILIADDSEMNRDLLAAILEDEYDIVQANDGVKAVDYLQKHAEELSLVLLDLVMPQMDGFEVLAYMNKEHWIDYIPVIIISAEDSPAYIKRGYDLGVTDFIGKPFDGNMVRRRSANAILLGAKQRRMTRIVTDQIYEREKSSKLMVSILSHIVEFRNGESGLHVLHIQVITDMLLRHLVQKEQNPYAISKEQIGLISTASALHDIGKITIPDEILNKPGRLTAEEFAVMKGHSMAGANMLDQLPFEQKEEPLVKTAYEICRWHHERYDGGGYPDGLKEDEIPISAQAVSLADVYDALTSERCYKAAYSHEKAIEERGTGYKQELKERVREVAIGYVTELLGRFRELGIDFNTTQTVFLGGGSILTAEFIKIVWKRFGGEYCIINNTKANAKGYRLQYLAEKKEERK